MNLYFSGLQTLTLFVFANDLGTIRLKRPGLNSLFVFLSMGIFVWKMDKRIKSFFYMYIYMYTHILYVCV